MALTATVLLVALVTFRNAVAVPLAADIATDNPTTLMVASSVQSTNPSGTSPLGPMTTAPTSLPVSSAASSTPATLVPSADTNSASTMATMDTASPSAELDSAMLSSSGTTSALSSVSFTTPVETSSFSVSLSSSAVSDLTTSASDLSSQSAATTTTSGSSDISTVESTTTVVSTVYQPPASTVTVTAPPQTVTDTITIVPPPTPSSTVRETAWSAPPQMTDLSAFNIQNFAYGQNNMRIIVSDPPPDTLTGLTSDDADADAPDTLTEAALAVLSAVSAGIIPPPPSPSPPNATRSLTSPSSSSSASASFLQLFYPANSVNPGQTPQGGADFYAAPLDVRRARNVSLAYSVFFPSDFDWVQGGKMPGIYGGHDGCSGGDDARGCFSTRLMWRSGGRGELYLYAPKDKQTPALCQTPPETVCGSGYGLSVARGAFRFAAGNWTHVRQTVALNTPGVQDGTFTLDVDGERVIELRDVFFRDAPPSPSPPPVVPVPVPVTAPAITLADALVEAAEAEEDMGSGAAQQVRIESIVDGANVVARQDLEEFTPLFSPPSLSSSSSLEEEDATADFTPAFVPPWGLFPDPVEHLVPAAPAWNATGTTTVTSTTTAALPVQTTTVFPTSTETVYVMAMASGAPLSLSAIAHTDTDEDEDAASEPVGFTGLFFSTFFGGHESRFATPKDQFTWFKDFEMRINDD